MLELILAAATLLVCAGLLLRLALGPDKRRRWDAAWRRAFDGLRSMGAWVVRQWRLLRARGDARRQADQAVRRARRANPEVERTGNVIRPRSFRTDDSGKPPLH